MDFFQQIKDKNAFMKVKHVMPYIKHGQRILDFGCGDLSFSKALHKQDMTLNITGIDVVDFKERDNNIHIQIYDGKRIPFESKQFDVVISYHVLHHTVNPFKLLNECMRVCSNTLLLVEPVYRIRFEIYIMSFMDWIFNVWKEKTISMTYIYKTKKQWLQKIESQKWNAIDVVDVDFLPKWIPTGRSHLFVCKRK